MARLNNTFNLSEMDTATTIPEGNYTLTISEASVEVTKNGKGEYLKLKCQVIGPTNAGFVIFQNINIVNPSTEAEKIGRRELAKLMQAISIDTLYDTDQLLGSVFTANVKIQKATDDYDAQNYITGYKKADVAIKQNPENASAAMTDPAPAVSKPKERPW